MQVVVLLGMTQMKLPLIQLTLSILNGADFMTARSNGARNCCAAIGVL